LSASTDSGPVIPRESRPRAYAGVELLLELMHILREATQLDHDSIIIACVVNHATMRPLLTGPGAPLDLIDAANPPDGVRGSISRSSVADITGIPRETVRRKINHLIEIGMLVEAAPGHVRPVAALANPVWQRVADDGFAAVKRFNRQLAQLGCEIACDHEGAAKTG
jgi:biotin operon repressor